LGALQCQLELVLGFGNDTNIEDSSSNSKQHPATRNYSHHRQQFTNQEED